MPCSCGGVLEKMSWSDHLVFNISFVILSLVALYFSISNRLKYIVNVLIILFFSTLTMIGLFLLSEDIIHNKNNFTKRFPPFPAKRVNSKGLKFNSYYFAGKDKNRIYLGNHSAPALITEIDTTLQITHTFHIKIADTLFDFRNIQLRVIPPNFYLFDGTVPCIFKGSLNDTKAILQRTEIPSFTKAEVIDSSTFVIRRLNETREHLLSTLDISIGQIKNSAPHLLQKQIDGLFDTDGTLQYSQQQRKFVYLYYYRNQ